MPRNLSMPPSSFWRDETFFVLDQLLLPAEIKYIECKTPSDVIKTIVDMNLRGAPLIGAAASAGIALFFNKNNDLTCDFRKMEGLLLSTRPTAVNLKNVLEEAADLYEKNREKSRGELFAIFKTFSEFVLKRDRERNFKIGEKGADFVEKTVFKGKKLSVLTHCNAGALATCGYGTALGVIRSLNRKNLLKHVWIDETRPYLQGARLTAFEMVREQIPHAIITDGSAAWLMHEKEVDLVVVGADRVAANGDLANKIGSYSLAVNANFHNIPFLSAMPLETFDLSIREGSSIVIEKRSENELLNFNGKRIAPDESSGLHLCFDVVPAGLISAIITENGVVSKEITRQKISGLFK